MSKKLLIIPFLILMAILGAEMYYYINQTRSKTEIILPATQQLIKKQTGARKFPIIHSQRWNNLREDELRAEPETMRRSYLLST
ncbi:MAG: hypothetical protein HZA35_02655 [Parcubacteria group bacterium]|nr:hypothetical protein [Parcubacteria group bacterium]